MGFNGICMNSIGVQLNDKYENDNKCQQYITQLSEAAQTYLNPETYVYKGWGVAKGVKSSKLNPVSIKVGSVWTLSSTDNTMKKTYTAPAEVADAQAE